MIFEPGFVGSGGALPHFPTPDQLVLPSSIISMMQGKGPSQIRLCGTNKTTSGKSRVVDLI
jgi:hypothetical protein